MSDPTQSQATLQTPSATVRPETAPAASRGLARSRGIALCLSGGGFRAALFHLGALRRLHETGILSSVETVSSVSGGSILAAFLATALSPRPPSSGDDWFTDWEREVAAPFRAFTARDLRTLPVLAHALWNWLLPEPRARHMQRLYRSRLTGITLGELPERPNFIFCATDLTYGVNFEFSRQRVGDWQVGYTRNVASWPLSLAVAASACFPPVFGPMRVRIPASQFRGGAYRGEDRDKLVAQLSLTDGGVYDNMALEPVWKNHRYVLVSDGGAPFELQVRATPLRRLLRYTGVLTNQARALRKRALFGGLEQERYQAAYWSIAPAAPRMSKSASLDAPGYGGELVTGAIARIRTDLDSFSEAEMAILENHGYFAAERAIRRRLEHLVRSGARGPIAPHPAMLDEAAAHAALRNSHKRLSLQRLLRL